MCAQKRVEVGKAYIVRVKRATFEAYGGCKCACCGEATFEFLSIDHTDNNGAVHRKELRRGEGSNGGEECELTFGLSDTAIRPDFAFSAGTAMLHMVSWAIVPTILPIGPDRLCGRTFCVPI